ncbi:MAG TPA: hypothetical protein VFS43_46770 [Polyangiaceae bacterium]|nr:hypothetical protein [Polyangiaceae bacterium]
MTRSARCALAAALMGVAPVALASDALPPPAAGPGEGVEALGLCALATRALARSDVALRARARANALCRPGRDEDRCREARRLEVEAAYRDLLESAAALSDAHSDLTFALDLAAGCRAGSDLTERCTTLVPALLAERRKSALDAARALSRRVQSVSAAKP